MLSGLGMEGRIELGVKGYLNEKWAEQAALRTRCSIRPGALRLI
jgi:hypothetical protein